MMLCCTHRPVPSPVVIRGFFWPKVAEAHTRRENLNLRSPLGPSSRRLGNPAEERGGKIGGIRGTEDTRRIN